MTDFAKFKLSLAEEILKTIRGCPHCESCSELAKEYFEAEHCLEDGEAANNTCVKCKGST